MLQGCQLLLFYWSLRNLLIYLKLQLLGYGVYTSVLFSFFKNDSIFLWLKKKFWSLKNMKTNEKGSQEYSRRWEEELGFQQFDSLLHLSHAVGRRLWILDFECLERAALRRENLIKHPKIHIFQEIRLGRNKPKNPPIFTSPLYYQTRPLSR